MRPVQMTAKLREPALRRVGRTRMMLEQERRRYTSHDERRVAYAVIELQNTWCEFARALFLSYALRAKDPRGRRVTHRCRGIRTVDSAIREAVACVRPKRKVANMPVHRWQEPRWQDPRTLTRLVGCFVFSNATEIIAGLSVSTRVFEDLPAVRNFYAHKNQDTRTKACERAAQYGLAVPRHPTDLVLSVVPQRPQGVGEDWASDVYNIIDALT